MKKHGGASLIIVLILVVLIAILGSMAIRSSIMGLELAMQSQVQVLLLENSDAALFNIEDPKAIPRQLAQDGMFSYFNSAANIDDELVFCYRATSRSFFNLSLASVILPNGQSSNKLSQNGFCKATDFSSGRPTVLSQVYLKKNIEATAPLSQLIQGTSLGQSTLPIASQHIAVTVISVLPSLSKISTENVEACFQKKASEVSQCFRQYNVPYNTQHADYVVTGKPILITPP